MNKIRVLIADDHAIVRAGIRSLLDDQPNIEVIAEASNGCQAIELATRLQPDIVLMDIVMGDLDGMVATQEIRQCAPEVKVLALTMHDREEFFFAMLKAGALGYVLKGSEPNDLLTAIDMVYRGEPFLSPAVTKAVLEDYLGRKSNHDTSAYDTLTLREKEVLHLTAEGKTTREMAELLHLSAKTVEKHRAKMMEKLELQNLTELIKYAIRKGLIDVDEGYPS